MHVWIWTLVIDPPWCGNRVNPDTMSSRNRQNHTKGSFSSGTLGHSHWVVVVNELFKQILALPVATKQRCQIFQRKTKKVIVMSWTVSSQNSYIETLVPQHLRMSLYVEMRHLKRWKLNEAIKVGPNPADWRPYKKREFGPTERYQGCVCTVEDHVRTQ